MHAINTQVRHERGGVIAQRAFCTCGEASPWSLGDWPPTRWAEGHAARAIDDTEVSP